VEIADDVESRLAYVTPDGKALLYNRLTTDGYGTKDMVRVNLETLEAAPFALAVGGGWEVVSWSPDGAWVVLRSYAVGLNVVSQDGSQVYEQVTPYSSGVYWLTDGTLLLVEMQYSGSGKIRYERVARFDPATGQSEDVPLDLEALPQDPARVDVALAELGLTFASGPMAAPVICNRVIQVKALPRAVPDHPPVPTVPEQPTDEDECGYHHFRQHSPIAVLFVVGSPD
jgi:hypothetical protein